MPNDAQSFMETFEEAYDDLAAHERPVFMWLLLRGWRDNLQASIKGLPTGAEKENALRLIQKIDDTLAEIEHAGKLPPGFR